MRLRPGILAANRRRGGFVPPPYPDAHRYWRVLFDGVASGDRVNVAEIEFLSNRFYTRKDGTFTASGSTSGAVLPANAHDGAYTRSLSSTFWQSNTGATPIWFKIDAGSGEDFVCEGITLAKGNLSRAFSGFQVQWSDDDSTWTTAWTETDMSGYDETDAGSNGSYPNTSRPYTFTNPGIYSFTPEAGFSKNGILLWLKSYDGAFTDEFTTPATAGQGVRTLTNHAGGSLEFRQSTSGRRPIFRTGGVAGLPYLEFDRSQQHWLEDVAISLALGSTVTPPGRFGILCDVEDHPFGDEYAVIGNTANLKSNIYLRNLSTSLIRLSGVNYSEFSGLPSFGETVVGLGWGPWSAQTLHYENDYGSIYAATTGSATVPSTAVTSAQLFRSTTEGDGGYFDGKVYEMIYALNSEISNFGQVQAYHIQQYLLGRRLVGLGGPLPSSYYKINDTDIFAPASGDKYKIR